MSAPASQGLQAGFAAAQRALQARRPAEALELLAPLLAASPPAPALHRLLAQVRFQMGDLAGAIEAQREAARLGPRDAAVATDLAEMLLTAGRAEDAVAAARAPGLPADAPLLAAEGAALKALGRKAEALDAYARARDAAPKSAVAWHNLASAAGDLQRFVEAEAATARARALGLDAPETWLVRARALLGLDRWDEADAAFREALKRRPAYVDAHRDLAQLLWMRSADVADALAPLDAAAHERPNDAGLAMERARVLSYAGRAEDADAALAPIAGLDEAPAPLLTMASQIAQRLEPTRAARLARRAYALRPEVDEVTRTLAEAHLAMGEVSLAAPLAEALITRAPDDGANVALQALVWRLAGDPRAAPLHDYDTLVRGRFIDAPAGWPDLATYLRDLTAALERLHGERAHPIGQSLRGGSQTTANLLESDDPAIRAFPSAIDGPIRAYLAELGPGDDPVRRRNTGGYRLSGIWSVRLRSGGRHVDHLHPQGWISSACHIALPPVVEGEGREGWLKFGEPAAPTQPPLSAEVFVKPEPGRLVLFPSFMWHGTTPFESETPRLTVAFDLMPA